MANTTQVLPLLSTRGSYGIKLIQGTDAFKETETLHNDPSSKCRTMAYSEDGSLFSYCDGENLKVMDMTTSEIVFQTPKQKTISIVFSPKNKYIALWEAYFTTPQNPQGNNNFDIYDIQSGECVKSMVYRKQNTWKPQWTSDEAICGRCVSNEVQFYEKGDFRNAAQKLYLQGIEGFSFSPASQGGEYLVAAHVAGKKGSPSFVRLFKYPNFGDGKAIGNKSFFKADKVDMMWNKKGSALLILVSAEIDTTGRSYYGEHTLHFMNTKGESSLVPFDKKGPIYSVDWNPNSQQFCAVFGYMPAKATLFNLKCEPTFDFGTGARNTCKYNAHGNILCLAGFGNLHGVMEMWNVDAKKVVSKPQAADTTSFEWCPDGQHFFTATCSPRLRVSNGYKIWHYSGQQLLKFDVEKSGELWEVLWQSQPDGSFPVPRVSAAGVYKEVKKEAYRPPSARGLDIKSTSLRVDELPQNQRNNEQMSAAAIKNKKKREAAKKTKQNNPDASPDTSSNAIEPEVASMGDPEVDKKIKALRKKIKQIEDLKKKQKEGKQLEKNQLDKLNSEKELLKELNELQIK